MIDLHITSATSDEFGWQNQLKAWCVAHRVTEDPTLTQPLLFEGGKRIEGVAAINSFLKEYRSFMDEWYDCRCDKWLGS